MNSLDENDVIANVRALEAEEEDEGEDEDERTEFCFCKRPEFGFMIACDGGCKEWFHGACVKIKEKDRHRVVRYFCPDCTCDGRGKTTWKDNGATVVHKKTSTTDTNKRTTAKRKTALEIDAKHANKHRREDSAISIDSDATFNGDDPTPRTLRTPRQRKRANMRASRLHDRAIQASARRIGRRQSALSLASSLIDHEPAMKDDDDTIAVAASARHPKVVPKPTVMPDPNVIAQKRISLVEWSQRSDLHYSGRLAASDEHGPRPQQSSEPSSSTMGDLLEEEDEERLRASNQKPRVQQTSAYTMVAGALRARLGL